MSDASSHTGTTVYALLRDPAGGDAWGRFVRRYGPRVHGWCRRNGLADADAEEVVQEVLVRLVRGLGTFDPSKGRFTPWLRRVTRHAWLDYLDARRRGGIGAGSPDVQRLLDAVPAGGLEDEVEAEHRRELVEDAVGRLKARVSDRDHAVFVALALGGRTPAEVAAEHGMKVAAVYVVKSRLLKLLEPELAALDAGG